MNQSSELQTDPFNQVSKVFADNNIDLISGFSSREEYIISAISILSIIDSKYGSITINELQSNIVRDFGNLSDLLISTLDSLSKDVKSEISDIIKQHRKSGKYYEYLITQDRLGTILQKSFSAERRKELAVNYTVRSDKLLSKLLSNKDLGFVNKIIDPFCGSGRLITSILETNMLGNLEFIAINDIVPAAVLLAYYRFSFLLKILKLNVRIQASLGDGFELIDLDFENNFDLVITNPPFTRSQLISERQRAILRKLSEINKAYAVKPQGQAGLHIWSIFLADYLLSSKGILLSVLPTSAILSRYSIGVRELLLDSYNQFELISSKTEKSFSEDSIFRELIIVASRTGSDKYEFKLLDEDTYTYTNELLMDKITLQKDWNWDRYFRNKELLEIRDKIKSHISTGKYLDLDISRGLELYGPDFYFFPNRYWKITNDEEKYLEISNQVISLHIPKKYLVKVFRQAKLYHQISPKINEYTLSIPDDPPCELKKYIEINIENASPAKKRFGKRWLNHIHDQIRSKNPVAHLFIIDKFSLATQAMLVHYTDEPYHCTKNFYIIRTDRKMAKLLAAWMNSTIYISLYLTSRREIGGSFGRLQIVDYKEEKLFPKFIHEIDYSHPVVKEIFSHFDTIREKKIPPIIKQINEPYWMKLDMLFIKLFDQFGGALDIDINELHNHVHDELNELVMRDNK